MIIYVYKTLFFIPYLVVLRYLKMLMLKISLSMFETYENLYRLLH